MHFEPALPTGYFVENVLKQVSFCKPYCFELRYAHVFKGDIGNTQSKKLKRFGFKIGNSGSFRPNNLPIHLHTFTLSQ